MMNIYELAGKSNCHGEGLQYRVGSSRPRHDVLNMSGASTSRHASVNAVSVSGASSAHEVRSEQATRASSLRRVIHDALTRLNARPSPSPPPSIFNQSLTRCLDKQIHDNGEETAPDRHG